MNLPNILTTIRLITVPFILTLLFIDAAWAKYTAFALLIIAWITDIFDGRLAKSKNLQTKFGAFYDPFVDKILVSFTFIMMGWIRIIPMWLIILLLFRDFLTQGIRSMVKAEGKILKSEWSGKIKFGLQMFTLCLATFLMGYGYGHPEIIPWMLKVIFWVMIITTTEAYYALIEFLWKNRRVMKKWL